MASPARWGRTALAYSALARLTIVALELAGAMVRASLSPPKRVEVSGIVDGKLCAHLQPIRFNGMKGAYASVKAREDPEMVLQPVELCGIHDLGRHTLVLDAVVGT